MSSKIWHYIYTLFLQIDQNFKYLQLKKFFIEWN